MAKAPIPGYVKTRLTPFLSHHAAASLHRVLVRHSLDTIFRCSLLRAELHGSEPHPFFTQLQRQFKCALFLQKPGHLGQRMLSAITQAPGPALLMGSDCPCINPELLQYCAKALPTTEVIFLPAEDGGYGLLGCSDSRQPHLAALLDQKDWGTATVMAATRRQMQTLGVRWREIKTVWDVDREADVVRLYREKLLP